MDIYSNIVPESKVREVQRETLNIIADALYQSFGPKGSTTTIVKNYDKDGVDITVDRTKDGFTIVKNILFYAPIERSVQDTLTELTRYVVKEVGDGTTSAVLLCKMVFDCLCDNNSIQNITPSDILKEIDEVVQVVKDRILALGTEATMNDIYNIALISTNNNEYIAQTLLSVYEEFGLDVFIDVGTSTTPDCIVKKYDGMTMDVGYTDPCFINDKTSGQAIVRNPHIYFFKDPIDTPEMVNLVNTILDHNIIIPMTVPNCMDEVIPTVIFCKKISPDTTTSFERIVKMMNGGYQVPLLIVSDVFQDYLYEDIAKMCGAPFIKKYLNPDLQKMDIEAGLAPTNETIFDFCGYADEVCADDLKTKVINPCKMFNEDRSGYSEDYTNMLKYLENLVQKCEDESAGVEATAEAKRRLNSFKGNMVDFLVGGITASDRDNLKASVEDAVLNCRSASINGVGYGANFMALKVLHEMINEKEWMGNAIVQILYDAYCELVKKLYAKSFPDDELNDIVIGSLSNNCPLNIRTNEYDHKVLSSIRSDVVILDTINKILSLMYTCNQYLVQTPMHNMYVHDHNYDN